MAFPIPYTKRTRGFQGTALLADGAGRSEGGPCLREIWRGGSGTAVFAGCSQLTGLQAGPRWAPGGLRMGSGWALAPRGAACPLKKGFHWKAILRDGENFSPEGAFCSNGPSSGSQK